MAYDPHIRRMKTKERWNEAARFKLPIISERTSPVERKKRGNVRDKKSFPKTFLGNSLALILAQFLSATFVVSLHGRGSQWVKVSVSLGKLTNTGRGLNHGTVTGAGRI